MLTIEQIQDNPLRAACGNGSQERQRSGGRIVQTHSLQRSVLEASYVLLICLLKAQLHRCESRVRRRNQHERDGKTLAVVTGLVPCPLTTFILTYGLIHNKLAVSLAAVAAMLGCVITTLARFAVAVALIKTEYENFP